MNTITGHAGEPHVTAQQQRDIYAGIFGNENYVLDVGNKLSAELVDNNTIRIMDGVAILAGGHAVSISNGDYEEAIIQNGTIGYNRIDYISIHYFVDSLTNIEHDEIIVLQGEPSADVAAPPDVPGKFINPDTGITVDSINIRTNAPDYYFPIYQVNINGASFTTDDIIPLFNISKIINNINERKLLSVNSTYFKNYYENIHLLSYKKSGDIVEVRGTVTNIKQLSMDEYDTGYLVASLPLDCYPSGLVSEICQGSSSALFQLKIDTDGSIKIFRYRDSNTLKNIAVGSYLAIHSTFLIN